MERSDLFIGLMSGTSLDGVDAVLAEISPQGVRIQYDAFLAFPLPLRQELLLLNGSGSNEIERSQIAGNQLAQLYAQCIADLLSQAGIEAGLVNAIGSHGQTIRHRPDLGFTVQIGNASLLAELSGIRVISDFRCRDIAAGGQGAPLVPAFHQAVFADQAKHRAVLNIGGISNISYLPASGTVLGFDCGPGNLLLDAWIQRHLGSAYDRDGAWAASGAVIPALLARLMEHAFFSLAPPKSTGRDDFHMPWLERHLLPAYAPADVQATLLELTAAAIAQSLAAHCADATEVYLCGGGAYNNALRGRLEQLLLPRKVMLTDELGIPAHLVEAAAFAWLAKQAVEGLPGNLPSVTGAAGPRILGAIYPA
jgi:anhydro-N-acetylmuramic acid kinase